MMTASAASSSSGKRLLAVAVLSRHGPRNPFPFPVTVHGVTGDGEMNDWGHEMMCLLGKKIRQTYHPRLSRSSSPAGHVDVHAMSSPSKRCVQSAMDTLSGLTPGTQVPVEEDPLLAIKTQPMRAEFLRVHESFGDVIASAIPDPKPDQDAETQVRTVIQHCDNVHIWIANGNPLPDSLSPQVRDRMSQYMRAYYDHNYLEPMFRRSSCQLVMQVITSDLTLAANSYRPTILLYNTHDAMIDMLMYELMGHLPDGPAQQPFAASLTFELEQEEKEDGNRVIHVWYNKEVHLFPGEKIMNLPLRDFEVKWTA